MRDGKRMRIGKYKIKEELGAGGMAQVYLAEADYAIDGGESAAKSVVIKVPNSSAVTDPRKLQMFHREIRLAMSMNYPHIVPVFDAGTFEGLPYIVMAFVPGKNLDEVIWAMAETNSPIAVGIAVYITLRVAYALNYAHSFTVDDVPQQIIHRDVAPKNIMVDSNAGVQLMDFGVAAALSAKSTSTSFKGTFGYAAAEHAAGEACQASDIFSLGGVLWALLEGKPFRFDVPADKLMAQAVMGYVSPLTRADVPNSLRRLVYKMLEKDPRDRPSLADVIVQLEELPAHGFALKALMENRFGRGLNRSGMTQTDVEIPEQLRETLRHAKIQRDRAAASASAPAKPRTLEIAVTPRFDEPQILSAEPTLAATPPPSATADDPSAVSAGSAVEPPLVSNGPSPATPPPALAISHSGFDPPGLAASTAVPFSEMRGPGPEPLPRSAPNPVEHRTAAESPPGESTPYVAATDVIPMSGIDADGVPQFRHRDRTRSTPAPDIPTGRRPATQVIGAGAPTGPGVERTVRMPPTQSDVVSITSPDMVVIDRGRSSSKWKAAAAVGGVVAALAGAIAVGSLVASDAEPLLVELPTKTSAVVASAPKTKTNNEELERPKPILDAAPAQRVELRADPTGRRTIRPARQQAATAQRRGPGDRSWAPPKERPARKRGPSSLRTTEENSCGGETPLKGIRGAGPRLRPLDSGIRRKRRLHP